MKCADLPVINIKIKCLSFHAVFAPTIIIKANTSGYGVHGIILVSSDNEVKKSGRHGKSKRWSSVAAPKYFQFLLIKIPNSSRIINFLQNCSTKEIVSVCVTSTSFQNDLRFRQPHRV